MDYRKVKDAAKRVTAKGPALDALVLGTMKLVSTIVGDTLGPGGRPVLIERSEHDLPAFMTKDGVTVFRSLGFEDPSSHCIMEAMRDAATRTAREAGDGTTTATILSESIVRRMKEFCAANPTFSPQKAMRRLHEVRQTVVEPLIRELALKCDMKSKAGRARLRSVAQVSANGDEQLADAVMKCYDAVGDEGNVTIVEQVGDSKYAVDKIAGYPVGIGYEDCCGRYWSKFVNDPARNRCAMQKPVFILYHGKLTEVQTLAPFLMKIGTEWGTGRFDHHNVVVVATGFSDSFLSWAAINFAEKTTINVYPLLAPINAAAGAQGQLNFLHDLRAVTGAKLFDPMNEPLEHGEIGDLGPGVEFFEAARTRSNIVGHAAGEYMDAEGNVVGTYEDLLLQHVDDLKVRIEQPESELDLRLTQERLGKVTGGIARLLVVGSSNGELKERRDRADDAVCAVRGALKDGCLPGGGWTLAQITKELAKVHEKDPVVAQILRPALVEPIERLLTNAGLNPTEVRTVADRLINAPGREHEVYDAQEHCFGDALKMGILDSVPAVLEAVRNSLSIASQMGTLGGIVVYPRDGQLERAEAQASENWIRDASGEDQRNEADLRP